jgi:hypothetical protein
MLSHLGGRKFILSLVGIGAVTFLAFQGKDAAAFGSIAVIVAGFVGGNAYIDGKHSDAKR